MGADVGFEKISSRDIPENVRAYISHHVRNELCKIALAVQGDKREMILGAVKHIVSDLERIGC